MLSRMRKGLIIASSVLVVVLLSAAGGYLWVKNSAWSEVEKRAAVYGVLLEKPGISVKWKGGLHFVLSITDLKGKLQAPLPASGPFSIPQILVDLDYDRELSLAVLHSVKITDLDAELVMKLDAAQERAPEAPRASFEIPRIATPVVHLEDELSLPVHVDLQALEFTAKRLRIITEGENAADLRLEKLELKGTASIQNSEENPKDFRIKIAADSAWKALSFESLPSGPDAKALWVKDEGGEFKLSADAETASLSLRGKKMSSSLSKKATDWSIELRPLHQTDTLTELSLKAQVPELLDLKTKILTARRLNIESPKADLVGSFSLHPDLALMVVDKLPLQFSGKLNGDFTAKLSSKDQLSFKTQILATGLNLQLEAEADLNAQSGQSKGNFILDFDQQKIVFEDKSFAGRISLPFKLIWKKNARFFVETQLRLRNFSYKSKDIDVHRVTGLLPVKQSWSFQQGGWDLNPRLAMNAFGRVDFESFEPLENSDFLLRIESLRFEKKIWGAVELELRINQNLLRSTGWRLGFREGRLEGSFLLDLRLENPKLGLLARAFRIHPEEVLPPGIGQGEWLKQPLSFYLGMDWDIAKAEAQGRIDWTDINSAQVMGLLEIMDPQFENKTYNQARTILSSAYPTRVQVDMKGRLADLRINTNLVALPEVRDIALSPYLLRANERLYQNEFYRQLRALSDEDSSP